MAEEAVISLLPDLRELLADRAYLKGQGIRPIIPGKSNRRKSATTNKPTKAATFASDVPAGLEIGVASRHVTTSSSHKTSFPPLPSSPRSPFGPSTVLAWLRPYQLGRLFCGVDTRTPNGRLLEQRVLIGVDEAEQRGAGNSFNMIDVRGERFNALPFLNLASSASWPESYAIPRDFSRQTISQLGLERCDDTWPTLHRFDHAVLFSINDSHAVSKPQIPS